MKMIEEHKKMREYKGIVFFGNARRDEPARELAWRETFVARRLAAEPNPMRHDDVENLSLIAAAERFLGCRYDFLATDGAVRVPGVATKD